MQVTPYDICTIVPDWYVYTCEMNRLNSNELAAAGFIGVSEQYIMRRASGNNVKRKVHF